MKRPTGHITSPNPGMRKIAANPQLFPVIVLPIWEFVHPGSELRYRLPLPAQAELHIHQEQADSNQLTLTQSKCVTNQTAVERCCNAQQDPGLRGEFFGTTLQRKRASNI